MSLGQGGRLVREKPAQMTLILILDLATPFPLYVSTIKGSCNHQFMWTFCLLHQKITWWIWDPFLVWSRMKIDVEAP